MGQQSNPLVCCTGADCGVRPTIHKIREPEHSAECTSITFTCPECGRKLTISRRTAKGERDFMHDAFQAWKALNGYGITHNVLVNKIERTGAPYWAIPLAGFFVWCAIKLGVL